MSGTAQGMFGACDELVAAERRSARPRDWAVIEAFARQLSGLQGLTGEEAWQRVKGVVPPPGFPHARFWNANDGSNRGGSFSTVGGPINICWLIGCARPPHEFEKLGHPDLGEWVETIALPIRDPGVLELAFRYEPRA